MLRIVILIYEYFVGVDENKLIVFFYSLFFYPKSKLNLFNMHSLLYFIYIEIS